MIMRRRTIRSDTTPTSTDTSQVLTMPNDRTRRSRRAASRIQLHRAHEGDLLHTVQRLFPKGTRSVFSGRPFVPLSPEALQESVTLRGKAMHFSPALSPDRSSVVTSIFLPTSSLRTGIFAGTLKHSHMALKFIGLRFVAPDAVISDHTFVVTGASDRAGKEMSIRGHLSLPTPKAGVLGGHQKIDCWQSPF